MLFWALKSESNVSNKASGCKVVELRPPNFHLTDEKQLGQKTRSGNRCYMLNLCHEILVFPVSTRQKKMQTEEELRKFEFLFYASFAKFHVWVFILPTDPSEFLSDGYKNYIG